MNIADHLRPLLRDHDCVIIPDFGGLVAEYTPARVQPGGRHLLSPPTRQVAFNQALTRNDGLLVDALRQHLGLPAAEAREAVRLAVAALHHELQAQQHTELPGIGVFRHVVGRGLQFEYTGTDNLLAAAFGLPELVAHPVRVTDVRLAREQQAQLVPRLRSASRGFNWRRVVPGASIGLLAGVAVASLYLFNLHPAALPVAWRGYLPRWEQAARPAPPQQAALAQPTVAAAEAPTAQPAAVSPEEASAELVSTHLAASEAPTASPVAPSAAAPAPVATPVAQEAADNEMLSARLPSLEVAPAAPGLPQQVAHQTPDPVEALLAQPKPTSRKKKNKVPPAALPAVADESNIARPVPLALRPPSGANVMRVPPPAAAAPKPAAATASAPAPRAAAPVAHAPGRPGAVAVRPVVSVRSSKAVTVVPAKKAVAAVPAKPAAPKPVPVAKAPAPPVATPVAPDAGTTTIKSRTGRYYVVVAAYGSLARAEQGRRNLAHAGRPAKIIMPPAGSRLYRLSAADFADRPTALLTAAHLRQTPNFDKGLTIFPY